MDFASVKLFWILNWYTLIQKVQKSRNLQTNCEAPSSMERKIHSLRDLEICEICNDMITFFLSLNETNRVCNGLKKETHFNSRLGFIVFMSAKNNG